MKRKGLLITPDLCIGCRACQVACKSWNNLPAEKTKNRGTHENPPDLSGYTYNKIKFIEKVKANGDVEWLFVSQRCRHCGEPACVQICPVGALKKDAATGIVYYDKEICIGCQSCRAACPYDIPRYDDKGKISKCHLCIDRVKAGLEPACAKTCPTGAIKFGDRDELIKEARKNGYKILYGLKEHGGLGVVYALKKSPKEYELTEVKPVRHDLIMIGQMLRKLVNQGVAINQKILKEIGLYQV